MRRSPIFLPLSLLLLTGVLSSACGERSDDPVARGERVYRANCIACHHMDPAKDGVMGPAVAGASRELLEARVLRAEYPEGHKPVRETALMQAMPYLRDDIPDLAAYLATQGDTGAE